MIGNLTSNTFNEAWIASAWKKLTKEIAYKTYDLNLPLTADDMASRAIIYALKPGLEGTGKFPSSEKHFLYTARKIAKWTIIDAIKKSNKMQECESIDKEMENDDGTVQELSQYEVKYVLEQFHADKNYKEMLEMGKQALGKLDTFLAKRGVSERDIEIYKDRDLYNASADIICAKHSITRENLYKIVSVIKSKLRMHGRSMIQG